MTRMRRGDPYIPTKYEREIAAREALRCLKLSEIIGYAATVGLMAGSIVAIAGLAIYAWMRAML